MPVDDSFYGFASVPRWQTTLGILALLVGLILMVVMEHLASTTQNLVLLGTGAVLALVAVMGSTA